MTKSKNGKDIEAVENDIRDQQQLQVVEKKREGARRRNKFQSVHDLQRRVDGSGCALLRSRKLAGCSTAYLGVKTPVVRKIQRAKDERSKVPRRS